MTILQTTNSIVTKSLSVFTRIPYSRSLAGLFVPRWRTHAMLFAPPKTGSTWLTKLILEGLGWQSVGMTKRADGSEQEMELTRLLEKAAFFGNVFSPHQHCRFNRNTRISIEKGRIKPIILSRNIFDCLISFRDHFNRESTDCSMGYMSPQMWQRLSDTEQLDFMIEMVAPWYLNFYASWMDSDLYRDGKICWLTYAELLEDTVGSLERVYQFLNVKRPQKSAAEAVKCVAAMGAKSTRKNKGVRGRGAIQLTDEQQKRVVDMARFYPGMDFSLIGLPTPFASHSFQDFDGDLSDSGMFAAYH